MDVKEAIGLPPSQIISDESHVKCGEIIMEYHKNFIFVCLLCTKHFDEMDSFGVHILTDHLEPQSEDEEIKPFECLFLDEKTITSAKPYNKLQTIIDLSDIKNEEADIELQPHTPVIQASDVDYAKIQEKGVEQKDQINLEVNSQNIGPKLEAQSFELMASKQSIPIKTLTDTKPNRYHCNTCEIQFRHKISYIAHAQKHHGKITKSMKYRIIYETQNVISAIKAKKQKKFEIKRRNFSCPQCDQICRNHSSLVTHVYKIHGTDAVSVLLRKYTCKYCDEKLKDLNQLKLHIETQHPGDAKYVCKYCDRTFKSFEGRRTHIFTHTGERPYLCPHCPKRFSAPGNLKTHVFSHLNIKSYACQYCNKMFTQSNDRNIHEQRHTGERSFQCEDCGKRFFTSTLLAYHRKRHQNIRNYTCDICEKSYFVSTDLKEHKKLHFNERNFPCENCRRTFKTLKALKKHATIHSN